ncbi:MAG: ATP-binding cassette domain-containing protein [Clostridia bacterium]|nr:ATP-binding cassette domain-containing protein [Clostridia bacterium]
METFNIDIKEKKYFNNKVLQDFTLNMPYGSIVGLLGLNGTGKTTLFDCIAGLEAYRGNMFGLSCGEFSYMCIRRNLFSDMSIKDAVNFYADFYKDFDKKTALKELAATRLNIKQSIRSLSAGQYRIVTFILAINCDSKIYLFDEPLSNLDIIYKNFVIEKLISTISEEKIYIVASHELPDLENVFSHIAVIKEKECAPLIGVEEIREQGKSISDYYKGEVIC